MILISPDIRIVSTLKTGMVYYFVEESFGTDVPHYFIVLNKNPRNDSILLLVCATSHVGKVQLRAVSMGYPPETLVKINPGEASCFTMDTIINCNTIIEKSIPSIVAKLTAEQLRICTDVLSQEIIDKLIVGALASKLHSEVIKSTIRGN